MDNSPQGYIVETVKPVPKQWICLLCNHILKKAVQTDRGERACKDCYKEGLKLSKEICPIDKGPSTFIFEDRFVQKEILKLLCFCKMKKYGCVWKGILKDLEEHENACEYYGDNKEVGSTFPISCPWGCREDLSQATIDKHPDTCEKFKNKNFCVFTAFGCDHDGKIPINTHLGKHLSEHNCLLVTYCLKNTIRTAELESKVGKLQQEKDELTKEVESESRRSTFLKGELEILKDRFNKLEEQVTRLSNEKGSKKEIAEFYKMVECINTEHKKDENTVGKSKDKHGSKKGDGSSAGASNTVEVVKKKVLNVENDMKSLKTNFGDLDLRQQLLENTCFGGKFIWKIDKLSHRITQAKKGIVTALHSAPCFTEKFSYKFCGRIYLNGDGMGKGSHISLFFVLMRSEYDSLLQWPFKKKVTFKLINHVNDNDSIKEVFIPDSKSPSFQRPHHEMNMAAGCPRFMTLNELHSGNFIVDDSIYIETIVG